MSGILGIWNLDGRPVDPEILERMRTRLAHRGKDHEGQWIQGPVGFATQLLRVTPEASIETQPVVHSSGAVLVFDGRLDNREELLRHCPPLLHPPSSVPDSTLALAAFEAFGEDFPDRLLGDFALGLFEPGKRRLLLARDAIGLRPLYFRLGNNLFLFASEVKPILAHPLVRAQPDEDLLADFLLGRMVAPEGRTFFQDIKTLLPGHLLTVTPERCVTRRYWDFDLAAPRKLGSFEDYAAEFRCHLHTAVKRRLRSATPVCVSLSGGLDSSSIYCLAETLGQNKGAAGPLVHGISYTPPGDSPINEKAFLQEIERTFGVPVTRVPAGPPGFIRYSRQLVWQVEAPFLDGQWTTTLSFLDTAGSLGSRVILGGHWADQVLCSQAYLVDLAYGLRWGVLLKHLWRPASYYPSSSLKHFRRRFLLDLIKEALPESLLSHLRKYRLKPQRPWYTEAFQQRARTRAAAGSPAPKESASLHARALYEEVRSSHRQLCLDWHNKVAAMRGMEMAFPFLDRELLAFLMSIPGEVLNWEGVPKAILREAMRGVVPDAIRARDWRSETTTLIIDGIEWDYRELVHAVHSDPLAVRLRYVRPEVLKPELARLRTCLRRDPSCKTAWTLSDLIGLELWLQAFWGNAQSKERLVLTT